jgi:hypothetical protein
MTCARKKRFGEQLANEYATVKDSRGVFADGLNDLYQLSFMLTGDHEKAQQSLLTAQEDCGRQTALSRSGRVLGRAAKLSKMQSVN